MAKNENPPFVRGETFFGIGGTPDATSGFQWEGAEFISEDVNLSNTSGLVKPHRSELPVVTRIVRNKSGFALLPKRVAKLKVDNHGQVNGNVAVTADGPLVAVDEHLPAAGCADNDLCHVVVQGPALVTTALALAANINAGDRVIGATAATTGATTAGRVQVQSAVGLTEQAVVNQAQNALGVAMTARTTAETAADILVQVRRF